MAKEYIERDKLLEKAVTIYRHDKESGLLMTHKVVLSSDIIMAPAADVAPVVRCRECYYKTEDGKGAPYCISLETYLDDELNFYCANGKRKEGAENG